MCSNMEYISEMFGEHVSKEKCRAFLRLRKSCRDPEIYMGKSRSVLSRFLVNVRVQQKLREGNHEEYFVFSLDGSGLMFFRCDRAKKAKVNIKNRFFGGASMEMGSAQVY